MHIRIIEIPDITNRDPSLFVNDVRDLNILEKSFQNLPKLTAFRFSCSHSHVVQDNIKSWEGIGMAATRFVYSKDSRNPFSAWLFIAHGAWQNDNRIVRHNKLWKPIAKEYTLKSEERSGEVEISSEAGIRYALSCKLTEDTFVVGLQVLRNRSSAIILSNRDDMASEQSVLRFFSIAFPLRRGLAHHLINWGALVSAYCPDGDIIVGPIGCVDERENSLYVLGLPNRLALLGLKSGFGLGPIQFT